MNLQLFHCLFSPQGTEKFVGVMGVDVEPRTIEARIKQHKVRSVDCILCPLLPPFSPSSTLCFPPPPLFSTLCLRYSPFPPFLIFPPSPLPLFLSPPLLSTFPFLSFLPLLFLSFLLPLPLLPPSLFLLLPPSPPSALCSSSLLSSPPSLLDILLFSPFHSPLLPPSPSPPPPFSLTFTHTLTQLGPLGYGFVIDNNGQLIVDPLIDRDYLMVCVRYSYSLLVLS